MSEFLLDTNCCIDFAKGRSVPLLRRMEAASGLAISTITLAELRVGARDSGDADSQRLDAFLRHLAIHPFDIVAAERYGSLIREIGLRRQDFDRLIAAHALVLDLTLVTNDGRHFADVPGLRVENWTLPVA